MNALPKSAQPAARSALKEVRDAEDREHTETALDQFVKDYEAHDLDLLASVGDGLTECRLAPMAELGASPDPDCRTGDRLTPVLIVSPKVHQYPVVRTPGHLWSGVCCTLDQPEAELLVVEDCKRLSRASVDD